MPPAQKLPQRDRTAHGEALRAAVATALAAAAARRQQREPDLMAGTPGFYLDFAISAGSEVAAELLENRKKKIELVAFRQESENQPAVATVFVPDTAADYFVKKADQYRSEQTPTGRPRNQSLIDRIDDIALAAVRSLYTDDPALLPGVGERIWWEVWVRQGHAQEFERLAPRLEIPVEQHRLVFPDRGVRLSICQRGDRRAPVPE